MKKLLFLILTIVLFSCGEDDTVPFEHQQQDADIVTDRSGRQYTYLINYTFYFSLLILF
ncbi:MAG: hypothetical protein AAF960_06490 [Bacteroidota bacterium]